MDLGAFCSANISGKLIMASFVLDPPPTKSSTVQWCLGVDEGASMDFVSPQNTVALLCFAKREMRLLQMPMAIR